jgi:hypothetical protein
MIFTAHRFLATGIFSRLGHFSNHFKVHGESVIGFAISLLYRTSVITSQF